MKKLFLLLIITVCIVNQSRAQLQGQERIDSLLRQLPKANEDTGKVKPPSLASVLIRHYKIKPQIGK